MRYLVRDEDGLPFRKFWSHQEALQFAAPEGMTVEKLPAEPKPPKPDLVELYGEAPF